MTAWLLPVLAGFCTGILSAWGVGGGTLLLLLMTLFFGVAQADAMADDLEEVLEIADAQPVPFPGFDALILDYPQL